MRCKQPLDSLGGKAEAIFGFYDPIPGHRRKLRRRRCCETFWPSPNPMLLFAFWEKCEKKNSKKSFALERLSSSMVARLFFGRNGKALADSLDGCYSFNTMIGFCVTSAILPPMVLAYSNPTLFCALRSANSSSLTTIKVPSGFFTMVFPTDANQSG